MPSYIKILFCYIIVWMSHPFIYANDGGKTGRSGSRSVYYCAEEQSILVYYPGEEGKIMCIGCTDEFGIKDTSTLIQALSHIKDKLYTMHTKKTAVKFAPEMNNRWIFYYPNGRLLAKGYFYDGFPDGEWNIYDTHGVLWVQASYTKGMKNGSFSIFKNGKGDRIIGYYMNNVKSGKWEFQAAGKEGWEEAEYVNGKPVKQWKYQYPGDTAIVISYYENEELQEISYRQGHGWTEEKKESYVHGKLNKIEYYSLERRDNSKMRLMKIDYYMDDRLKKTEFYSEGKLTDEKNY